MYYINWKYTVKRLAIKNIVKQKWNLHHKMSQIMFGTKVLQIKFFSDIDSPWMQDVSWTYITYIRRSKDVLNNLSTFNLRPVSRDGQRGVRGEGQGWQGMGVSWFYHEIGIIRV